LEKQAIQNRHLRIDSRNIFFKALTRF